MGYVDDSANNLRASRVTKWYLWENINQQAGHQGDGTCTCKEIVGRDYASG